MLAPPVAAASSPIHPPPLLPFEQPKEKALDSESTVSQLCFPNEFPYEFAITSPDDLTETEDDTNDDEDDFLAGLTRRLALFTQRIPSPPPPPVNDAKVNSPESTLSGLGSCGNKSPNGPFSQTHSPPETPVCEKDSLKSKVSNFDAKPNSRANPKPNNSFAPFPQNAAFYNYNYYCWLRHSQAAMVTYQYPVTGVFAAPTAVKQQQQQQPQAAALVTYHYPVGGVFTAPTAVVNQPSSGGTGVFFPLKGTNPSRSRRKEGKCVKFPKVVQTQPPKTEKLSGRIQSRSQGCLSTGRSKLDRGTKSSVVTGGCPKEERHLPKEWVY